MLRPVTDTVTETRQSPPDSKKAVQRRPVVLYTDNGAELDLVLIHVVLLYSEGRVLLSSLTSRLTSLEDRMTRSETAISETAISQIRPVQERQMAAFETVTQNIASLTDMLLTLNLAM